MYGFHKRDIIIVICDVILMIRFLILTNHVERVPSLNCGPGILLFGVHGNILGLFISSSKVLGREGLGKRRSKLVILIDGGLQQFRRIVSTKLLFLKVCGSGAGVRTVS